MCIVKSSIIKKLSTNKWYSQQCEDIKPLQKNSFPLEISDLTRNFINPPCFQQNPNQNLTNSDISQSNDKKTFQLSRKRPNRYFTNIQQDQVQFRSQSYNTKKQSGLLNISNKIKITRYSLENKINSQMALKMSHSEVSTRDTVRTQNYNNQKLIKRLAKDVTFSINKTSYDCFLQNQINKQSLKLSNEIQKQQRLKQLSDQKLIKKKMKKIPIFSPFLDESFKENQQRSANIRISRKRPQNEQFLPIQLVLGFMNEQMKNSAIKQDNQEKNKIYPTKKYMSHNIKCCFGTIIGKKQHYQTNLQQQY